MNDTGRDLRRSAAFVFSSSLPSNRYPAQRCFNFGKTLTHTKKELNAKFRGTIEAVPKLRKDGAPVQLRPGVEQYRQSPRASFPDRFHLERLFVLPETSDTVSVRDRRPRSLLSADDTVSVDFSAAFVSFRSRKIKLQSGPHSGEVTSIRHVYRLARQTEMDETANGMGWGCVRCSTILRRDVRLCLNGISFSGHRKQIRKRPSSCLGIWKLEAELFVVAVVWRASRTLQLQ